MVFLGVCRCYWWKDDIRGREVFYLCILDLIRGLVGVEFVCHDGWLARLFGCVE